MFSKRTLEIIQKSLKLMLESNLKLDTNTKLADAERKDIQDTLKDITILIEREND